MKTIFCFCEDFCLSFVLMTLMQAALAATPALALPLAAVRCSRVAARSNAQRVDGHCFFQTGDGARFPGGHSDWPGRQPARAKGDRIGMRLDLGAGSLTVFKNGALLGVMQGSGLEGRAYRWAVSLEVKGRSMRLAAPSAASVAAMEAEVEA